MPALGTYHPLLTEAWFSIGVNHMLTRDWHTTAQWHDRIPALQDQVEGYPVFLPARSMSQADYIEIVTLLRKAARGDRTSKTTKSASTEETVSPQVSKPRTTENKDTSFSAASNTTTTTTGRSTTNAASPTVETKAAPTAAPSQSTASSTPLKQYPMYTKRAQTVSMWLQAMLTADREVAVPAVATASRKDVAPAEGAALVSDHEDI
ncbi:hypothetical protein HKX48_005920 [Thoreauomyces humboldtii]|nr:hypothetical protein HKX48_005920 [Thoreauomyces humboldtii]